MPQCSRHESHRLREGGKAGREFHNAQLHVHEAATKALEVDVSVMLDAVLGEAGNGVEVGVVWAK